MNTRELKNWVLCTVCLTVLLASLLFPCVLLPDESGAAIYLPRISHAWIVLTQPEILWKQWFLDYHPNWLLDRLPIMGNALATLAVLYLLGSCYSRTTSQQLTKPRHVCFSILAGYLTWIGVHQLVILSSVFLTGVRSNWMNGLISFGVSIAACGLVRFGNRNEVKLPSHQEQKDTPDTNSFARDQSFDSSWQRRLIGLTSVAIAVLFLQSFLQSLQPTVDVETKRMGWATWIAIEPIDHAVDSAELFTGYSLDPIAPFWLSVSRCFSGDIQSAKSSTDDLVSNQIDSKPFPSYIQFRYAPFLTGKVTSVLMLWTAFFLLASCIASLFGVLPGVATMLVLVTSPAFLELSLWGRYETVVTCSVAFMLTLVCSSKFRLPITGATPTLSTRTVWVYRTLLAVSSLPILISIISLESVNPAIADLPWNKIARFVGFSSLVSGAWLFLVLISPLGYERRTGLFALICLATSCSFFAVLGVALNAPDRTWVPFLVLHSMCIGMGLRGTITASPHLFARFRFALSLCLLLVVVINALAWPTLDHRLFASYSRLLSERTIVGVPTKGDSIGDVNFAGELQRIWMDQEIERDAKLLLLGHWDSFDIPFKTIAIDIHSIPDSEDELRRMLQERDVDYIGFVRLGPDGSHQVSNRNAPPADDSATISSHDAVRRLLVALEASGTIESVPVSAQNRDLSVYRVTRQVYE